MRKISLLLLFVLAFACPATAQMTGYSINVDTGLVTTFSCEESGDPDCFRYRTELGTINSEYLNGFSAATTLAPSGDLVVLDGYPEFRMDWYELPSLGVVSSLYLVGDFQWVNDIAFGPDSTLWLVGVPGDGIGGSLYTVDQATGEATEVWNDQWMLNYIAFVGERMFLMAGYKLLEFDSVTGFEREVADYYNGGSPNVASLTSFDDRLWSLSFVPAYPPGPPSPIRLGAHDLENGDHDVLVGDFDWAPGEATVWWTLDLVDTPEQQPFSIPTATRGGLLTLIVLTGIGGWLLLRRRV